MAVSFGSAREPQLDFSADKFEDAAHALSIKQKCRRGRLPSSRRRRCIEGRSIEQREPELHGIHASGVSEFVDEGLHHESDPVASRSAHRACGYAQRHDRSESCEVRNEAGREFIGRNLSAGREAFAFAKCDEMIAPRDELAGSIDAAL